VTKPIGNSEYPAATSRNVQVAFAFSTGVDHGQEAAPIVANNTMFIVTPYPNNVFALNLTKPGASIKWSYQPHPAAASQGVARCDVVNRGAAYSDDKLFFNTLDDNTIALDAETGTQRRRSAPAGSGGRRFEGNKLAAAAEKQLFGQMNRNGLPFQRRRHGARTDVRPLALRRADRPDLCVDRARPPERHAVLAGQLATSADGGIGGIREVAVGALSLFSVANRGAGHERQAMKWRRCFSIVISAASMMIGAVAADAAVLRVCADPNKLPFSDLARRHGIADGVLYFDGVRRGGNALLQQLNDSLKRNHTASRRSSPSTTCRFCRMPLHRADTAQVFRPLQERLS
jgi:hypothetical protein